MDAEKRVKKEARDLLSKGNWSQAVAVLFMVFAALFVVLFVYSIVVLSIEVILTPVFESLSGIYEGFSLENEESVGYSIISLITSNVSLLIYAVGFVVLFPVFCGFKRYFYLMAKGENPGVNEVLHYLVHDFRKCTLFGLRYGLICVVKFLPCFAPAYAFIMAIMLNDLSTLVTSILTLAAFVTGIAGIAVWVLWTSKHFLCVYLFIENDNLPAGVYVKESERILGTQLNKSARKLMYSFGGWFLFALTGVGLLYFVPYFETAAATSAKWMIKLDKEVY